MNEKEMLYHKSVIGLHEPAMPLYHDPLEQAPVRVLFYFLFNFFLIFFQMSQIGSYVHKTFPRKYLDSVQDTVVILPFQEIGHKPEQDLIRFFDNNKKKIAWINIDKQPISGIGALQFNIGLKK